MVKISDSSLRGYLLEEALAFLIRDSGYKLILHSGNDPTLDYAGNGLRVRGRGAYHQADVLGELNWIPAFTFPTRLFVEAKAYRKGNVSVAPVRNAMGVLADIRENKSTVSGSGLNPFQYNYFYALFSTTGFSEDAARLALAHQISLVDLSQIGLQGLIDALIESAEAIVAAVDEQDFPRGGFVKAVREYLRGRLGTVPPPLQLDLGLSQEVIEAIEPVVASTLDLGEVFVATADGPFMLILKARDPRRFLVYARRTAKHQVEINWSMRRDNGLTWTISPIDGGAEAYQLSFRLPQIIADWITARDGGRVANALAAKEQFLSSITIYRPTHERDEIFQLQYRPSEIIKR